MIVQCRWRQPSKVHRHDTITLLWQKGIISVVIALVVLLAVCTAPSEAAPLHPAVERALLPGFKLVELVIDTAVSMFILRNYRLRITRVAVAFLVTAILCTALFFPLILPAFDGNVWAGMICMILLQAAALFAFVNLDWFRNDAEYAAPLARTLFLAAFCGNAASLCFSIWVTVPLQFWLLRLLIHRT